MALGDAEDCVQDVFVAFLLRRSEVRNPDAWLRRALFRRAIQLLRREARRSQLLDQGPQSRPAVPNPDLRIALRSAFALLGPKVRRAVIYRYVVGLDESEAALAAGYSPGSAKQVLHRARVRLRAELARG